MTVEQKTLMVNVVVEGKVGTAITLDKIYQVCIYSNESEKVKADIELIDFQNVLFMGLPIENDYKSFKTFKEKLSGLGVNFDRLIEEQESVDLENMKELIEDYKTKFEIIN